MISIQFAYLLQMLATLSGLVVSIGLILHPQVRGWKVLAALSLLFFAAAPADLAIQAMTDLQDVYLKHRLIFTCLGSFFLVWSILSWRSNGIKAEASENILFLFLSAYAFGVLLYVVPYWYFESQLPFENSYLVYYWVPAVGLLFLNLYFAQAMIAGTSGLWKFVFNQLVTLLIAMVFTQFLMASGSFVILADQVLVTCALAYAVMAMVQAIAAVGANYDAYKKKLSIFENALVQTKWNYRPDGRPELQVIKGEKRSIESIFQKMDI